MLYAVIREKGSINLAYHDLQSCFVQTFMNFYETKTAKHSSANMFKIHDDVSWERAL